MVEIRLTEHRAAQSISPALRNEPLITFTGFAASQTCGIVHPRLSNSLRTNDGNSGNADAESYRLLVRFFEIKQDLLRMADGRTLVNQENDNGDHRHGSCNP